MASQPLNLPIVTRQEALAKGYPTYHTGKKCSYGHYAERNTESAACTKCEQFKSYGQGHKGGNKRIFNHSRKGYPLSSRDEYRAAFNELRAQYD